MTRALIAGLRHAVIGAPAAGGAVARRIGG
jgi:hypothetical protein